MLLYKGKVSCMNIEKIFGILGYTKDEYENLYEYLYKPYSALGGNGSAKKVMEEVNKLPIHESLH